MPERSRKQGRRLMVVYATLAPLWLLAGIVELLRGHPFQGVIFVVIGISSCGVAALQRSRRTTGGTDA